MAELVELPITPAEVADSVLFRGLEPTHLVAIVPNLDRIRYSAREYVFRKGEDSQDIYVVLKGIVSVRDPGEGPGTGRDVQVLRGGQIVGEVAFIDSGARHMDAICATAVELARLTQNAFYELVEEMPLAGAAILHNVANALAQRLRRTDEDLLNLLNNHLADGGGSRLGLRGRLRNTAT